MTLQEARHPTPPSMSVFLFDSIVEMIHNFSEADFALDVSGIGLFVELALGGSERARLAPCVLNDRIKGQGKYE